MQAKLPSEDSLDAIHEQVADFYRAALQGDPLDATTRALSRLVPGALHLAFLTGRRREVRFATSAGAEGRDFLLATMGAAASHPLIYRTEGRVRAITDVLAPADWRHREMYQAARPLLAMDDALGTDFHLDAEWMLSVCAIRDRVGFSAPERRALAAFLPHFRTVLTLAPKHPAASTHRGQRMHLIALPAGDQVPRSRIAARVRDELSSLLRHCPAAAPLAARAVAWIETRHQGLTTDQLPPFLPVTYTASTGTVVCVPATRARAGSILVHLDERRHPAPRDLLTAREREIGHWLCEGKTNAEIAAILGIRPATAKRHLENIYEKLGAPNRASALRLLLDPA